MNDWLNPSLRDRARARLAVRRMRRVLDEHGFHRQRPTADGPHWLRVTFNGWQEVWTRDRVRVVISLAQIIGR